MLTTTPTDGGDEDQPEPTPHLLEALASLLDRLVARNDLLHEVHDVTALDAFRAARPPSIGIGRYLERIHKYTRCSPACFVAAFVYVDRVAHRHPAALVVSLNVHRLLLASSLIASKVVEDVHYDNAFYARVGGVSNAELNSLELELLFLLDFRVMVSSTVFETYCMHLEKEMMFRGMIGKVDRPIPAVVSNGEIEVLQGQSS